jgi:hypothetical protein
MNATDNRAMILAPNFKVPKLVASDIRRLAYLAGVTESALLRDIVSAAVRRRLARRLKGQTVAP